MKRVLVTGATGFIGQHCLTQLVARGYDVHAVYSKASPIETPGVNWHQANLLEGQQIEFLLRDVVPSHLLHLAWNATPGVYIRSLENLDWLCSSLRMAQLFAELGGIRMVTAGTCFEYDWDYGYCREHLTPLAPSTLYGTCKHSLQLTLSRLSEQSGLSSAWGRIFFLYGPHEHPGRLVSSVIRALLRGEEAPCSPGTQMRDFLHVEDVAGAFVALLDHETLGAVNIASGSPVAVKDVVQEIARQLGQQGLVKLGALPARPGDPALLAADTGRLRTEVGYIPKYSLEHGIRETIRWWQGELGLPTVNGAGING
jgi:nucleoside-diphosphate-sugar epimerase